MQFIFPIFQYEIRYNVILDFSNFNRALLAPYVKMANGLGIDKQNATGEEVLTLHFEDDLYDISIYWDRVIFKGEGDISKFKNRNSVIDSPFFDIFNKIKNLENFGSAVNHLIHYTAINPIEESSFKIMEKFKKNFFSSNALENYGHFNDACIIVEQKDDSHEFRIEHGPYTGIEDFEKRKLMPVKDSVEYTKSNNVKGEMLIVNRFEKTNNVNFGAFKNLLTESMKPIENIWKQ